MLEAAADAFVSMREAEGGGLRADLLSRLDTIGSLVAKVEERSPKTVEDYRTRFITSFPRCWVTPRSSRSAS